MFLWHGRHFYIKRARFIQHNWLLSFLGGQIVSPRLTRSFVLEPDALLEGDEILSEEKLDGKGIYEKHSVCMS